MCTRIKGANQEASEEKARFSPRSVFFLLCRANNERRTGESHLGGGVRDASGFGRLEAGSRASFTSSRPIWSSTAIDLGTSIFHIFSA